MGFRYLKQMSCQNFLIMMMGKKRITINVIIDMEIHLIIINNMEIRIRDTKRINTKEIRVKL